MSDTTRATKRCQQCNGTGGYGWCSTCQRHHGCPHCAGVGTVPVLDGPSDLMRAARIVRSSSWPLDMAASMEALADRLDWLADHLTAGYVLVKADGLSHGDELVRVDGLRVTGTQDAPTFNQEPVWRRLRRSVPENGERPHTHTRGIDRGDCPECDAEYGEQL